MSESGVGRRPRVLSPETKWEIFLEVTSREMTQADAARKWQVDVSTIIGIGRTVKERFLRKPLTNPGATLSQRTGVARACAHTM